MQASDTGAQAGILVTGASGYLGRELLAQARAAGRDATGTHLTNATADVSLDVCDRAAVDDLMARVRPAAVVHTAYLQGGDRMRRVNVDGAAHVAAAAARHGARLIHLSTDFVFDGELARPYREDDPPGPVNEYGASKLDGEHAVLETHGDALVVRTSLIYAGAEPGPTERMVLDALAGRADVAFFEDELRSPVARGDLAAALLELAELPQRGVLHLAGPEPVSRLEFARLIAARHGADPARLRAGRSAGQAVRRPLDCVLDSSRAYRMLRTPVRGVRAVLTSRGRSALDFAAVATAEPTLSRARGRAVTALTFERAALITLGLLWLVVVTGGLVRLTASGLGCPHWPTCEANSFVPSTGYHSVIEFSNRVISGIAMVAAVITAVIAFRLPGLQRAVAWGAAAAAAGTVAQVPLGAITVAFNLNPLLVMSHFLLAMAVVAVATWVTFHAVDRAHGGRREQLVWTRPALLGAAAVVLCLALVTTGAFVTAAGPHAGATDRPIERFGNFYDATWVHVRAAVSFATVFLILAVVLWRTARGSLAQRLSVAGVVLTLCQLAVGEYQYRNGLPWEVIAVHVAIAGTLVMTIVTVASLVAYPPASRGVGSLERG